MRTAARKSGIRTIVSLWMCSQIACFAFSTAQAQETAKTKVYYGGPGVTVPLLLPSTAGYQSIERCHNKESGDVTLSLVVDAQGFPRNIFFKNVTGKELDEFALKIAEADTFTPARMDGRPIAFGGEVNMHLDACGETSKDDSDKKKMIYHLRAIPKQKFVDTDKTPDEQIFAGAHSPSTTQDGLSRVGGELTKPKVLLVREAEYSNYARQERIQGTSMVSLVVDLHGMPRNIRVTRSLEPSLDRNAVEAVRHWRFHPAEENGTPVSVPITVQVSFRLN